MNSLSLCAQASTGSRSVTTTRLRTPPLATATLRRAVDTSGQRCSTMVKGPHLRACRIRSPRADISRGSMLARDLNLNPLDKIGALSRATSNVGSLWETSGC